MRLQQNQLWGMVLATIVATLLFSAASFAFVGSDGVWLSLAAAAISLPVGAAVVVYFNRNGVTAESIVAGTCIRVFLTVVLAGAGTLFYEQLRVPVFFLALATVYLANLAVETWFAYKKLTASCRIRTSA